MRPGVRIAARYRLERRLGEGGKTEVWQAADEVGGRRVAIRLLHPGRAADPVVRGGFRSGARAAAGLTHPRIAAVLDHGEADGVDGRPIPYRVTEFLEGRMPEGGLAGREAIAVLVQVAEALAAAHEAGVAHGDLRPAKVVLCEDGVKVRDFALGTEPADPAYLPPERQIGPAADVYALGVMLSEALTGERNPDGRRPPHVSLEVAELCRRCQAYEPDQRPTAHEVRSVLIGAAAEPEPSPEPPPPPSPRRMPIGPARMLALTTVVGLVAAATLTVVTVPGAEPPGRRAAPPLATPSGPPPSASVPPSGSPSPSPSSGSPSPEPIPTSPSPSPPSVVTPALRPPDRATLVHRLSRVREAIEAGRQYGEIHPQVAAELDALVTDFQRELAAHRPVAVEQRLDLLCTKVAERYRAGAMTRSRAREILHALDAVDDPVHVAPASLRIPF
ncbi:serine/threonine-protein kinase [Thermomonospora amylolytica]|uniref:serine/threonine-protein kinase n=1 Tax=Thermomonospora amylolytica TaxID=1411117 RepID=UPI000E6C56B5|nr:serine/threonine-protein kinase [Thermomonospora amylolytica]